MNPVKFIESAASRTEKSTKNARMEASIADAVRNRVFGAILPLINKTDQVLTSYINNLKEAGPELDIFNSTEVAQRNIARRLPEHVEVVKPSAETIEGMPVPILSDNDRITLGVEDSLNPSAWDEALQEMTATPDPVAEAKKIVSSAYENPVTPKVVDTPPVLVAEAPVSNPAATEASMAASAAASSSAQVLKEFMAA